MSGQKHFMQMNTPKKQQPQLPRKERDSKKGCSGLMTESQRPHCSEEADTERAVVAGNRVPAGTSKGCRQALGKAQMRDSRHEVKRKAGERASHDRQGDFDCSVKELTS